MLGSILTTPLFGENDKIDKMLKAKIRNKLLLLIIIMPDTESKSSARLCSIISKKRVYLDKQAMLVTFET